MTRSLKLAPEVGLEPTTFRLTAGCTTIVLLWYGPGVAGVVLVAGEAGIEPALAVLETTFWPTDSPMVPQVGFEPTTSRF